MHTLLSQKGFAHAILLLVLVAGLGTGIYLVGQKTNFLPKASMLRSVSGPLAPSGYIIVPQPSNNITIKLGDKAAAPEYGAHAFLKENTGKEVTDTDNAANFSYKWENSNPEVISLETRNSCSNGYTRPDCPLQYGYFRGRTVGTSTVTVTVTNKKTNQKVATNAFLIRVISSAPQAALRVVPEVVPINNNHVDIIWKDVNNPHTANYLSIYPTDFDPTGKNKSTSSPGSRGGAKSYFVGNNCQTDQGVANRGGGPPGLVARGSGSCRINIRQEGFTSGAYKFVLYHGGDNSVLATSNNFTIDGGKVIPPTPKPTTLPLPTPTPGRIAGCTACSADINRDKNVNITDFSILSSCLGQQTVSRGQQAKGGGCANADADGNGRVDFEDYRCLQSRYGQKCGDNITPWVQMTYPNGGEVLKTGERITIRWTGDGFDSYSIYLYGTGSVGDQFQALATNLSSTTRSLNWNTQDLKQSFVGKPVRIVVTGIKGGNQVQDWTDNTFVIGFTPTPRPGAPYITNIKIENNRLVTIKGQNFLYYHTMPDDDNFVSVRDGQGGVWNMGARKTGAQWSAGQVIFTLPSDFTWKSGTMSIYSNNQYSNHFPFTY